MTTVLAAVLGLGVAVAPSARAADGVEPKKLEVSIDPGGSHPLDTVVHTPAVSSNPDVMFLADLTGSMGEHVANVQANITNVMTDIGGVQPTAEFGAAFYRDYTCDAAPFGVSQPITSSLPAVQAAVDVTHTATCDPGLDVTVSPDSRTVAAGEDATFTESIAVAPSAEGGATLHCTVQFLINDGADDNHREAVTVHVGGGGEKTPTEMVPMKAGAIKTKEGALKVPVVWSELVDPATGKGIPGKHVSFFVGEALLCETTTGPHGWAHCGGEVAGAGDRIGDGYEAVFAGDDTHEASNAHGTFFRLLPCTPKPPKWHWPWDWSHHHGGAR